MNVRTNWQVLASVAILAALGCSKSTPGASSVPVITSFSPAKGATGSTVVLQGSGFHGVSSVSVGGAGADFSIDSDNTLKVTVPDGAMSGPIGVVNALGTGGTKDKFYVTPTITSFTPTSGSPGTTVTLTGTGFVGATSVTFGGGPAASFFVNGANGAQAVVPYGSASGAVVLTTSNGDTASRTGFTYSGGAAIQPSITSAPTQGATGTTVALKGAGFTGVTSVKFGGVPAYFDVADDASLTATVPLNAVSGFIQVQSFLGVASSPSAFVVTPTITGISPASGRAGALVTLQGTGLIGTTQVSFGGTTPSNFLVLDANTIQANVAAGSSTGPVTILSNGQTCTSQDTFTFLADATSAPTITGVSDGNAGTPASISAGGTLTLTGTGFTGVTAVTVGGVPVPAFTVASDTSLVLTVPDVAENGFLAVSNSMGVAASPTSFVIRPTVTALSATQGAAGAQVTISGTGFKGTTSVVFGGNVTANFSVIDARTLKVQVPAGATTGPITVNASGLSAQSAAFTISQ